MALRKKTDVKKKRSLPTKAKKTIRRGSIRRETPMEKLAFRVSILEEGFDEIERELRDLHRILEERLNVIERQAYEILRASNMPIDVAPEPAHVPDEPIASENE